MISLRKINVLLIIIIFAMLLYHAALNVLGMFGLISYSPDFSTTGRQLFYPVVCHIIISLYLFFKDRSKHHNIYSKLIKDTTQQIVSGIGIIVFVALHILSYMYFPPVKPDVSINLLHFIIDNLLFVSIGLHLRVSIPRFLISLGFLEDKNSYKNAQKIVNWIILLIFIIIFTAESIFYIGGIL